MEDLIELGARDGKMRAQVLDGQIPGDVVVDVFFDLLRRVEIAHLKHPLVVNVADAGVENVAGGLDLVRGIVQLHIVKRTALLFVDAKLRGVGRDGVELRVPAVRGLSDADERDDHAFIIQRREIFRQPRVTSVLHGLSRAAAGLHMGGVAAVAAALKFRIFPHSCAEGIELDGGGRAFLKVCIKDAELQPRQRVKIVQQLRQTGVFQIQHIGGSFRKSSKFVCGDKSNFPLFSSNLYCINLKKRMIYGNVHKNSTSFFTVLKMFFSTLETFFTSPFISHMVKYNHERDFPFQHYFRRNFTMKKIIALLLAVMMVLAMAACAAKTTDTPAPAETDNKTDAVQDTATEAAADGKTELNIGVLVWKYSDTYGSSVRVAMDKYAKEIGAEKGLTINLEMQDGNDDQATQNNQADVMFAAGKDHIIINLCDTSAGQYLVDLAKQYNVPISFYNKEPVDSTIVTGSNSIFVGTKPEEAGIMQGEILADLYAANPERVDKNGDGKVMTLEFEGEINNPEAIARTEYSLSTAIEKGVPCEMMTENQVANWDTAKAQEMMTAQIASLGVENIEVVFCNNDDMAIGVIAALNEVGYNLGDGGDEIIVIGVDCTDTAVEYINAGKLYGTVKQDGDAMGKANILMAINGALGKDWLDGTDYTMADDGFSIRIPYAKITAE